MQKAIKSFRGEYSFLSNFYPCTVNYEGGIYPSVEHAFQAAKTLDTNIRKQFELCPTPSDAKQRGKDLDLRSDWEDVKVSVMYDCIKSKFQRPDLRDKLLSTGYAYIEEGNNHGDKIWGTVQGSGLNLLGQCLMKLREEIRDENCSK